MSSGPEIVVVSTMRNEGPFILDWLAHHRAIGVSRFVIFSNDCEDGTDTLLDRLARAGHVTHIRQGARRGSVQWKALRAARDHPTVKDADWVLCIDCDEFVNLRAPLDTLRDLVSGFPDVDAIAMPWRLFGHSGHLRFEETPVTERFCQAAPPAMLFPAASRFFKTFYRSGAGAIARPGIHRPKNRKNTEPPPAWIDGDGQPLPASFAAEDTRIMLPPDRCGTGLVQLNHYSVRSIEDFLVKRARGLPNRGGKPVDATYWAERNFNLVDDDSVRRHKRASEKEKSRLMADGSVAVAHRDAVRLYRQRIDELLQDAENVRLFGRLALLATSRPPDDRTASEILAMMARVQK